MFTAEFGEGFLDEAMDFAFLDPSFAMNFGAGAGGRERPKARRRYGRFGKARERIKARKKKFIVSSYIPVEEIMAQLRGGLGGPPAASIKKGKKKHAYDDE